MPNSVLLEWDKSGERYFQTGTNHGVLYLLDNNNEYTNGEAWNGLTGVDESPEGAEPQDVWADNIKYATFRSPENHGGTIKAYTFPNGFYACNGQAQPSDLQGMALGQQKRKVFGFCYRTEESDDLGHEYYILHLVYNCTVSPSSKSNATQNENPDPVEMSWDYKSTSVPVTGITGVEQTCVVELSSRMLGSTKMAAIEQVLYGSPETTVQGGSTSQAIPARLPLPGEVYTILKTAA